jgi:hypothetical protein
VAGERLVHGIVDHLGEKVMQGLFIGSADVHSWTPAHGLEALEHFDVARRVTDFGAAYRPAGTRRLAGVPARTGLGQIGKQVLDRILDRAFGCCFGDLRHASH